MRTDLLLLHFFYIRFIVPVKTTENLTMMICVLGRQQLYQHLKFY